MTDLPSSSSSSTSVPGLESTARITKSKKTQKSKKQIEFERICKQVLIQYQKEVLDKKKDILDKRKAILSLDPTREELENDIKVNEWEINLLEKQQISVKGQMNSRWGPLKKNGTGTSEWAIKKKAEGKRDSKSLWWQLRKRQREREIQNLD